MLGFEAIVLRRDHLDDAKIVGEDDCWPCWRIPEKSKQIPVVSCFTGRSVGSFELGFESTGADGGLLFRLPRDWVPIVECDEH
eukprot:scaffold2319_cov248-Pinguiococcus_pyrenoidosus.AAC.2